jgi:hypothetical protein
MITGSCTTRSSTQAAPDRASHASTRSDRLRQVSNATGAATQTLRQLKQSISLPACPLPRRARMRRTKSAGPSSFASRWVIRHVARMPRTKRDQKSISQITVVESVCQLKIAFLTNQSLQSVDGAPRSFPDLAFEWVIQQDPGFGSGGCGSPFAHSKRLTAVLVCAPAEGGLDIRYSSRWLIARTPSASSSVTVALRLES